MPRYHFPFSQLYLDAPARPYLPIKITNPNSSKKEAINTGGLIDTGADSCAIPAKYARLLGHNLTSAIKMREIETANGKTKAWPHTTTIEIFNFKGKKLITIEKALIDYIENLDIVILGVSDFLSKYVLIINYPSERFSLQEFHIK